MKTKNQIEAQWNTYVLALFKDCPGAFLTGSRAFGWAKEDSDYDVCVNMADKEKAFGVIKDLADKYKESEYCSSAKGEGIRLTDGKYYRTVTINPIPLHPMDMLCWWLATRELRHIATIDPSRIGDRELKHGAFETLRGFYKSMIPYKGLQVTSERLIADQALARRKDPA